MTSSSHILQQTPQQKQTQRLVMSPRMQQAIHLMQTPIMELSMEIAMQVAQNPILEYSEDSDTPSDSQDLNAEDQEIPPEQEVILEENNYEILQRLDEEFREHFAESGTYIKNTRDEEKRKSYLESLIQAPESLYGYLMEQAQQTFSDPKSLAIAQSIIGNLDDSGFFQTPIKEIAILNQFEEAHIVEILKIIQTFDPPGIAASSIQESLLIQLRRLHKENSLAYTVIEHHYHDMIQNRILLIQKHLHCPAKDIRKAIDNDISRLDIHPGTNMSSNQPQSIIPDVFIRQEDDRLIVDTNRDDVPNLRLNMKYLRMLTDEAVPKETKNFIQHHILSAKWFIHNLQQRQTTVERMATSLAERQRDFFINPDGQLQPLTMKMMADELELHESTIARAAANKYVDTPRGILPLRSFFTNAYVTPEGKDLSSQTVRDRILEIIQNENKKHPLSDQAISDQLNSQGIPCARRTVAKYRVELNLGNALQRKHF